MTEKNTFYVTTPIYYPNDIPHLGHAYTTIAADVVSRWQKLNGKEVFFLTGTDEHTKKVINAAEKAGKKPKDFVDGLIPKFKEAWKNLNIKYDRFIRTSDQDHVKFVQHILDKVNKKGDIYKGFYEGHYCIDCEAYYTETNAPELKCPIHETKLEILKEESYFFKLSKYENKLLKLYEINSELISPNYRKKEVVNRIKEGLKDLSISRTNMEWGIPLPFDKKHTCYVWFDALTNYLSGIGILDDRKMFNKFWPADVHIIGKDILWFHTTIWHAMLLAADIELPKKVFAHGWWTVKSKKMGKSAGNAISVDQLINYAGADAARYFLLREAPFGDDGDFDEEALISRHNNELADKLGNLVRRVSTLAEKYGLEETKSSINSNETLNKVSDYLEKYSFDKALNKIFAFIDILNTYIQDKKPWETQDKKVLFELSNGIKDAAILLWPFIPETSEKIAEIFNFEISLDEINKPLKITDIKKGEILFKKIL